MQLLDKAPGARLHDEHRALVPRNAARSLDAALDRSRRRRRRAHAEVLRDARIDDHGAVAARLVRVLRHELHVHERRFARLVEMLLRDHRVEPVEDLSARGILCGCGSFVRRRDARLGVPVAASRCDGGDQDETGDQRRAFHGCPPCGKRKFNFAQARARSSCACTNPSRVSVSARRASSTVPSSPRPPR